jgi:hypothetical protein
MPQTSTARTPAGWQHLTFGADTDRLPGEASLALDDSIVDLPSLSAFEALLETYRATGGTASGDDLARVLDDLGLGDFIGLARLISMNAVFGFEWGGTLWVPMFQFEPRDLSVRPETALVLDELGSGFDGWARAAWFAKPNCWLTDRRPVDMLETDLPEVLSAARIDRFIAVG